MGVKTKCEGCSKTVNAPDGFAGKTSNCPKCGGTLRFPAAAPVDDLFEDLIPEAPKVSTMPPEPPAEMQPVSYGEESHKSEVAAYKEEFEYRQKPVEMSYPPDGMPVHIKRINLPLKDAIALIIIFWLASMVIAIVLSILWFLFATFVLGAASTFS